MLRWKPAAAFAALLVLTLVLAGCVGGLGGPLRLPGLSGGTPSGSDVSEVPAFPSDDMRDEDLGPHVPGEILVKVDSEQRAYEIAQKLDAEVTGFWRPSTWLSWNCATRAVP